MNLVSADIKEQAVQVFKNLEAVAKAAGANLAGVVKLTIYLTDLTHFSTVNEVMALFFQEPYPARATIQISALPKDAQIEIDAIIVV
jgi:reactive intermediate/imine deaminase